LDSCVDNFPHFVQDPGDLFSVVRVSYSMSGGVVEGLGKAFENARTAN
jgi:hypothetical protein